MAVTVASKEVRWNASTATATFWSIDSADSRRCGILKLT